MMNPRIEAKLLSNEEPILVIDVHNSRIFCFYYYFFVFLMFLKEFVMTGPGMDLLSLGVMILLGIFLYCFLVFLNNLYGFIITPNYIIGLRKEKFFSFSLKSNRIALKRAEIDFEKQIYVHGNRVILSTKNGDQSIILSPKQTSKSQSDILELELGHKILYPVGTLKTTETYKRKKISTFFSMF